MNKTGKCVRGGGRKCEQKTASASRGWRALAGSVSQATDQPYIVYEKRRWHLLIHFGCERYLYL